MRKPFQGVWNIIRFNWHFYLASISIVFFLLVIMNQNINPNLRKTSIAFMAIIIGLNVISMLASFYIYDLSNLYRFTWLDKFYYEPCQNILNINAGFDETSAIFKNRFPRATLTVFDFYDAQKHTEISIERARSAYPPFPGTLSVRTDSLPIDDNSIDTVFCILSAHEIRSQNEREAFFQELALKLKSSGRIIVTEHLRDIPNFIAYTVGFFHFYSRKTWLNTFSKARLQLLEEIKITPFISSFILTKNGATP